MKAYKLTNPNSTRRELDNIIKNVVELRAKNAPTYWLTLISLGILLPALMVLVFKTVGIILAVMAAYVYIANQYITKLNEDRLFRIGEQLLAERKPKTRSDGGLH